MLIPVLTEAEPGPWQYKLTPYLWNVSFDGSTASGGNDVPVDIDYSFFTLDNLDNVLSGSFEASNGQYGFLVDGLRARYSDEASNILFDTRLQTSIGYVEGTFLYTPAAYSKLDLLIGARYVFLDVGLAFTPGPTVDENHRWVDPLLGLQYSDDLGKSWYYQFRGDIGGFGVASDLVVNLVGTIGYSINHTFGLEAGYRYLNIDFKEDDFLYDVSMQGLVVGLSIRF